MADFLSGSTPALPSFSNYAPIPAPAAPTDQSNWLTAGLGAGAYGALSDVGSAGEAAGKLLGAQGFADKARAFADQQRATAATYARPDLEGSWSPTGWAYGAAKALPSLAGFIGAGMLTGGGADLLGAGAGAARLASMAGAGAVALPQAVGQNVQTNEDYTGAPITSADAAKAVALGIPEAALQSIVPGKLEALLNKGVSAGMLSGALHMGGYQAAVGAATTGLTQLMGDPARGFASRANEIMQSAISGGIGGALFGGAIGHLAKTPVPELLNNPDALEAATSAPLGLPAPAAPKLLTDQSVISMGDQSQPPVDPITQLKPQDLMREFMNLRKDPTQDPDRFQALGEEIARRNGEQQKATPDVVSSGSTQMVPVETGREVEPFEAPNTALTDPRSTPPAPPSNALEGPNIAGALPPPEAPDLRPFADAEQYPSLHLNAMRRVHSQEGGDPRLAALANQELELRAQEQNAATPRLTDANTIYGPDGTPQPTPEPVKATGQPVVTPDVIKAGPPSDIPSAPFDRESDVGVIKARSALAGDEREPLVQQEMGRRVTDATRSQADTEAQVRAVAQTGKALPKFLQGQKVVDNLDVRMAVAKEIAARQAANKPIGVQIERLDEHFGATDAMGKPLPELLGDKGAIQAATSDEPPIKRVAPQKGDIPKAYQPKFTALEKLRTALASQDMDETTRMGLLDRVDQAQSLLRVPSGVNVREANRLTEAVKTEAAAAPVKAEREATQAPPASKVAPATGDTPSPMAAEQIKKFTDLDRAPPQAAKVAPPKTQAEAKSRADVDVGKLTRATAGGDFTQAAPGASTPEQRAARQAKIAAQEAAVQKLAATPQKGEIDFSKPATPEERARQAARDAKLRAGVDVSKLTRATDGGGFTKSGTKADANAPAPRFASKATTAAVGDAEARGRDLQDALSERSKTPDRKSQEFAAYKETATRKAVARNTAPASDADLYESFRTPRDKTEMVLARGAAMQKARLEVVTKALEAAEKGDMRPLRAVKDEHFADSPLDDPRFEQDKGLWSKIAAQQEAEERLMDVVRRTRGETPRVGASGVVTQDDVDHANIVNQTNKLSESLRHIVQNGSSSERRQLAATMLEHGVDAHVRFSPIEGLRMDNDRALDPGAVVKGSYNPALGRVNLYDGSDLETTILHEAVHAATQKAIEGNTPAGREIKAIYDRLKARSPGNAAYGLSNPKEMVAEALTNPAFRDFLKGERATTGSKVLDMWQRFKNAVFTALGAGGRVRSAFDQIMDTAHRAMGENSGKGFDSESPRVVSEMLTQASAQARKTYDNFRGLLGMERLHGININLKSAARQVILGWNTSDHIAQDYGDKVQGIRDLLTQQGRGSVLADSIAKPLKSASIAVHALEHKVRDKVNKAMQHTILGIDIFKPWEENRQAHAPEGAKGRGLEQAARLKKAWMDAQPLANAIRRDPAAMGAYTKMHDANDFNALAKLVYHADDLVKRDYAKYGLKGFENSPFDDYHLNPALHDDPTVAKAFMQRELNQRLKSLDEFSTKLKTQLDDGNAKGDDKVKLGELARLRSPVSSLVASSQRMLKQMTDSPYFHLGREGTHFAAGEIKLDETKLPDQAAVGKLQAALEAKGFGDATVMHNAENNQVYVKLRDPAEAERARAVFEDMQRQGVFTSPVSVGRGDDLNIYKQVSPVWMKRAIEAIQSAEPDMPEGLDDVTAKRLQTAFDQQKRDARQALMDMIPDNSLTKIYQRREGVQGFNADMIHSFDTSSLSNARGLAGMVVSRDTGKAAAAIKDQIKAINRDPSLNQDQREAYTQAAHEMILREASRMTNTPSPGIDTVRKLAHAVQIGMSPAYFVTLMTQIPSLSLPRLGSTHGYLNSARELARATPMTMKIVSAMIHTKEWSSFALRQKYLEDASIPKGTVDFIMRQAANGDFNQGAFTNSIMGHDVTGLGHITHALHAASTLGLYAEMIPRVMTALAAKALHRPEQDGDLHSFVSDKVKQSQMDWSPFGNPRQAGKQGTFGPAGPLVNQFMGFQIRMTEMLYREADKAFKGDPAARSFMLGHLAATTALAGTLGLPFMGVAASVYDRLADWTTGQDDHDIQASFRNYLADTFGKDAGEIIARGVPRAGGIDLSRAGESTIMPGSTTIMMLTEKRKLEDAEKDWLKSMSGSAVGVGLSYAQAIRDFTNGDVMNGMIRVAPEGLKNVAEAVQLGTRGFVSKDGTPLPITASAEDIALKVLGLEGSKEQEYNEAKRVESGERNLSEIRSQNITQHLLVAEQRGDQGMFQRWERASQDFQRDHPGQLPPIAGFGQAMQEQMMNAAMARALNTPLGVAPRNLAARGMTTFGNFRDQ